MLLPARSFESYGLVRPWYLSTKPAIFRKISFRRFFLSSSSSSSPPKALKEGDSMIDEMVARDGVWRTCSCQSRSRRGEGREEADRSEQLVVIVIIVVMVVVVGRGQGVVVGSLKTGVSLFADHGSHRDR